ncbi:MAG: EAL domain-containing protein [Cereibacter changlensis]
MAVAVLLTALIFIAAGVAIGLVLPLVLGEPVGPAAVVAGLVALAITAPLGWLLVFTLARVERQRQGLARREDLWRAITRFAKVGYWEFDVSTGAISLSGNVHVALGDPEHKLQLTLPKLLEMLHPEDRDGLTAALANVLAGGGGEQMEFRLEGLDGLEKTFWATGAAVASSGKQVTRISGACQDITERKALEAALRESDAHYRYAVELSPLIAWTEGPDGEGIDLDAGWLALTGMTQAEASDGGWVRSLHPEDAERTVAAWDHCLATGEPYDVIHRLRVADGSYHWVRTRAQARLDEHGEVIRWYGTVEDIHERLSAENALRESEAFARSILDSSTNCVEVIDLEGRLQFMNRPGLAMMGIEDFSREQGRPWVELWPEPARAEVQRAMDVARGGGAAGFTAACATLQGTPRWWEVSLTPIPDAEGRPLRLLSTARDVTEAKMAQDALDESRRVVEESARRLATVLESTTDSVIILDADWRIGFLNARAAEMMSLGDDVIGQDFWTALPGDCTFEARVRDATARKEVVQFEELHKELGIWLEMHVFPSVDGVSIFFRDVSRRREAQDQLLYLSRHDHLTGLPNRSMLREQLDEALQQATERSQAALLFLDLDEFKSVNDTWGHPTGDRLLVEAAARLRAVAHDGDRVARLGGDEFAVVQTGLQCREEAEEMALRLIAALSEPYGIDGRTVVVGVSIGIAMAADATARADHIIKEADVALYRAKDEGRGICRYYEPGMDSLVQGKQLLRADLRKALGRGELSLAFQPLMNFATGRVGAMEALLRWTHPQHGPISPDEFIPLAEETGVIVPLGAWVLHEACLAAATWPEEITVSVNLSPVQFRRHGLVEAVEASLKASGLEASRLQLEVTETVLMQNVADELEVLHALRRLGVRIAMDDFGTGYSSLSYLRRFPLDRIKIDREFVKDLCDSVSARAIVSAITRLADAMGIPTTAEGVELPEQLDLLRKLGCNEAQGYLILEPVAADRLGDPHDEASRMPELCGSVLDYRKARRVVLARRRKRSA